MTMGYDLKVNELNDNLPPHLEWSKADWEKARARMTLNNYRHGMQHMAP